MSTVVAVVALVFSYRQNIGWDPVVLASRSKIREVEQFWDYELSIRFEFWNRRKYPLSMRYMRVALSGAEAKQFVISGDGERTFTGPFAYNELDTVVAPHTSFAVLIRAKLGEQCLDALRPRFDIELSYFDPRTNRDSNLRSEHKCFYPGLGWKLSEDERLEVTRQFQMMVERDKAHG